MRRLPLAICAVLAAAAPSHGEDSRPSEGAVAASNGVVVHGVDTKLLAARLRETDRKALAGDAKGAGADLADILTGDMSPLIEDGENAYVTALEAALQRLVALPPEGIAAYRALVDPHAASVLAEGTARADPSLLARHALDMSLSTHGPGILVTLADLRAARGQVREAARCLADLLRLWPEQGTTETMPGVDRAAVVTRLAALFAALRDDASVRWLARETSAKLLDGASPMTPGSMVRDDLARCAEAAARRDDAPSPGRLRLVAEKVFAREPFNELDGSRSRDVDEHPVSIGTAERAAILTREPSGARRDARVVALAPAPAGETMVTLWSWPPKEEFDAQLRRGGRGAFTPVRSGDVVLFTWPTAPSRRRAPVERYPSHDDEKSTLVALSIGSEGRLIDERGTDDELRRDDGDPELVTRHEMARAADGTVTEKTLPGVSFCGRPLVVDGSVFTTMIRRTENGGATELHVARFDLVTEGTTQRLRERWRRHVLDGIAMGPVRYEADQTPDMEGPLATPAAMTERWGRLYVASNTGAVACLDTADGGTVWVHAYPRFGPPTRPAVVAVESGQKSWKDVPLAADGPFVWAAPRDADYLFQFRAMPRLARTTLVQSLRFLGGAGTSTEQGPALANLVPNELVAVSESVGWFAGDVPERRLPGLVPLDGPLASLRMREAAAGEPRRASAYAQIRESASFGSPCLGRGVIYFPTFKAIYRVSLADFEGAPQIAWQPAPVGRAASSPDQIGNLLVDGERLWSVTPRRAVLFEPK